MHGARTFNPGSTLAERALQAYIVLIGVAHNHQTITYVDLSTLMHGHAAPQTLNKVLGRIVRFCERSGLPRLPVLVVNKTTGVPGETEIYDGVDTNTERQSVFAVDWYQMQPPSLEDLDGRLSD